MTVKYVPKRTKKILHYIDRTPEVFRFCPHRLVANLYIGCEFMCKYCFAQAIKQNYFYEIQVRINAAERIEKELQRIRRIQPINLGSATDPYQPAEKKFEITRKVLELFDKKNIPCFIVTKSPLILRDLDLIKSLSRKHLITVQVTLPSMESNFHTFFEPNSPPPEKRLEIIRELSDEGIPIVVRIQPIIPFVNDRLEKLEELVDAIANAGARHIVAGFLRISLAVWDSILPILEKLEIIDKIKELYFISGRVDSAGYFIANNVYRYSVLKHLFSLSKKYKLTFGTCKEGFFEFHTSRCSGVICKGFYVVTVETFWRLLRVKGKLTLEDALRVIKQYGLSKKFVSTFVDLWKKEIYFENIPNVMKKDDYYIYVN